MNKYLQHFLLLFVFIVLFSCKVQQKPTEVEKVTFDNYSDKELLDSLAKHELVFDVLTAKAAIKYTSEKENSFKTHFRIKKDSAIWMSITPLLGIEMARILITKDTLKFINRLDKEYFIGSFDYVNHQFGVDIDYQMLEAILIGNSMDFEQDERKINSSIDRKKDAYFISTARKRKIRKEIKKDKNKLKEITQALWLSPKNFKVIQLMLTTPKTDQSIVANYSDHQALGNQLFPNKINVAINAEKNIYIDVDFTKIEMGTDDLSFSFKIPSKYERIEIK